MAKLSAKIPPNVINFITSNVSSVQELEVLQLLHSEPSREWSIQSVNTAICSSYHSIEQTLLRLERLGLIRKTSDSETVSSFMVNNGERGELAELLVHFYQARRTEAIELIYSKPIREILSFSQAFKIKGDQTNG